MGMHIAGIGNGVPYPELPQDRGSGRQWPIRGADPSVGLPKETAGQAVAAPLPGERGAVDIDATTADLERISLAFNRKLKFVVDHESYEVTVKVIDPETDKVIKVLPPEELQRLHGKIKETIGFLFDEQV